MVDRLCEIRFRDPGGETRRAAGYRLRQRIRQSARGAHWKVGPVFDLLRGTPAVDLDPRIAETGPDVVLMKSAPSIFFGTPTAAILTKERVDTVIVTGCITSGCIRASVIDAFSLGFGSWSARLRRDHDEIAHTQNLTDVERRYADVIDGATAIDAIEQWRRRTTG